MLNNQLIQIWQRLLHIVTVLDYQYALNQYQVDLMQDRNLKHLIILQEEQELHVKSAVIS